MKHRLRAIQSKFAKASNVGIVGFSGLSRLVSSPHLNLVEDMCFVALLPVIGKVDIKLGLCFGSPFFVGGGWLGVDGRLQLIDVVSTVITGQRRLEIMVWS